MKNYEYLLDFLLTRVLESKLCETEAKVTETRETKQKDAKN